MPGQTAYRTRARRILISLAIALGPPAATAEEASGPSPPPPLSEAALIEIARRLPELFQLSALDPSLAASLVPGEWLDLMIDSTLALAAEKETVPEKPDPPHEGPVGPWPTPQAFARSIETIDTSSVAALYIALKPRIAERCRARELSVEAVDRALRTSAVRITASSLVDRAAGGKTQAITPAQREFARLGVPVLLVVRKQVEALGATLWGPTWAGAPAS